MSRQSPADLLVEIGTEELPAGAQAPLARALADGLEKLLAAHSLQPEGVTPSWGPRRIAAIARMVPGIEPDREMQRRGPSLKAAFDAKGHPTKAAEGFARSVGVRVQELETLRTKAGAWLVHRETRKGRPVPEVLEEALPGLLEGLPQPRRMRWNGTDAGFLRPVRWLCVLFGKSAVPIKAFGLTAGGTSSGHRVHHPEPVAIKSPAQYHAALAAAHVQTDPAERRATIMAQATEIADALDAVPAPPDEALYEELAGLAEWPVALAGRFDPDFLALPEAVVVTTLAHHQRFIPLRGAEDRLLPDFVAIANLESTDSEQICHGLARVVRPRLDDARFYYQRDREQPLAAYASHLEGLQFAPSLGSMAAKSERIAALCAHIVSQGRWSGGDVEAARRAGALAKCDLVTGMVFEFPELQGVMGGLYAAETESAAVADAIAEQYRPAGADDALPETPLGAALALADRIDTLIGGFAAGLAPTGAKDAFGLRRAAFGALRIAVEWAPDLDLEPLLVFAAERYPPEMDGASAAVAAAGFLRDRLRSLVLEQGERPDITQAVLAVAPLAPGIVLARARALRHFGTGEYAPALAAANKRIANLLRQAGYAGDRAAPDSLPGGGEAAEVALSNELDNRLPDFDAALCAQEYGKALEILAELRAPVDRFFDEVLVMDPDADLRARRLALLARLREAFLRIADIGELQPPQAPGGS